MIRTMRTMRMKARDFATGVFNTTSITSSNLEGDDAQPLAFYWHLLERWWRIIAVCTVAAPLITAVVCLMIPRSYRAEADIKPLPSQNNANEGSNILQQLYGGLGQTAADQSKEYIATMSSFSFTRLVLRHDPVAYSMLFSKADAARYTAHPTIDSDWRAHLAITRNFSCYFDQTAGLLRLRYVAHNPKNAQRMLSILLADLIASVRERDIAGYAAQIKSLETRANQTSDGFLRADLYEIIAKRIEQLSTADASALVAFRMIEAPFVPPEVYQPRPLLYAAASAAIVPIVMFGMLVLLERSRAFIHEQTSSREVSHSNGLDKSASALAASRSPDTA
jgi:hypothetical protein